MKTILCAIVSCLLLLMLADAVSSGVFAFCVLVACFACLFCFLSDTEPGESAAPPAGHDVWSGQCYGGCGRNIQGQPHCTLHQPGHPPKHFCDRCRPSLASSSKAIPCERCDGLGFGVDGFAGTTRCTACGGTG